MTKSSSNAAAGCLGVMLVGVLLAVVLLAANTSTAHSRTIVQAAGMLPKASATFTPSPTATNTPTPTPTPTQTPSPTLSPTPTLSPVPQEPTLPPTKTPTPSLTPTPIWTPTPTNTPTPLPTPDGALREFVVPILMYHYISVPPEDADDYRLRLSVTPDLFEAHLAYLQSENYTSIDLYHLLDALTWGRPLPEKPIIITLDDGYRDNYENAFPLLQKYNFTATFFILTEPIDYNSDRYMTWAQIEEMAAAGMGIEPHTKTHPDLRNRDRDFLTWQILGSAQTIEAHIGRYPRFFAYPSSRYDENVIEFLQEINFWGAVTTWNGTFHNWEDRYELRRVRLSGGNSPAVLAEKLSWTLDDETDP